ncbi:MAG TPA: CoA-binding protein [Pseudobdellovibrionaceae bacterium]|nr:CoA-binding protein [Pseudobdellovibrionaceae bacterium]
MGKTVAILGASNNPNRFSYRALRMLIDHGHKTIPVSPKMKEIEGVSVLPSLADVKEPVDTLTMYVGPERSTTLSREILNLHPKRVIFNPGSENRELAKALEKEGVQVIEDCTLVMLREGSF